MTSQPVVTTRRHVLRATFWFAAFAGILLILLHDSVLMGKGLVAADAVLSYAPWRAQTTPSNQLLFDQYGVFLPTHEFMYQQKGLALWNPDVCCGVPNLGAIQYAPLFPIRWLFSWLDPFSASGPSAFLKLCLAGWFTMLYIRLLGVDWPAAFLSGMAFSLSGFMIVWLGHPHVNCAMWLPLLLYFVEKTFHDPDRPLWYWAGFALAFAIMLLGGHPPTAIQITLFVGAYFLFRLTQCPRTRRLAQSASLVAAIIVGIMVAAPQILPYLEYYHESSTAISAGSMERWASHLNPRELIHFVLPNVMGNPAIGFEHLPAILGWNDPDNYNERTDYVGFLPLFFAFYAVVVRRCKLTTFFLAAILYCLLIICGLPPFPIIMRSLPILSSINQVRLLLLVGFGLAVLAGLGWDQLQRNFESRERGVMAAGFCAIIGLVVVLFWLVIRSRVHFLHADERAFMVNQMTFCAISMVVVLLLAIWPARSKGWMILCLCWTAMDLLGVTMGYNPAIPRPLYYPTTPAIQWLQQDHSIYRIYGKSDVFPGNTAEVYGLNDVRGGDYETVRRYEELIRGNAGDFFFYLDTEPFPPAFPLLNVKYILSEYPAVLDTNQYQLAYADGLYIYKNKQCLDRAFLVADYEVQTNQADLLDRVRSGHFNPRQTVLLEQQPALAKPVGASPGADSAVRFVSYEPNRVTLEASSGRPGFLVLLDTYFSGWRATVNGQAAKIYRADYNFRAVQLPAGKSSVTFTYWPRSFVIGLCLCAAGILIIICAFRLKTPQRV